MLACWKGDMDKIQVEEEHELTDKAWCFLQDKSKEVSLRKAETAIKKMFHESDVKEWRSIVDSDAVRLLSSMESKRIREDPKLSNRIMRSRWVLTDKDCDAPSPGRRPEASRTELQQLPSFATLAPRLPSPPP